MSETEKVGSSNETVLPMPTVKEDWYQTETQVILVLLAKNVDGTKCQIDFASDKVSVRFPLKDSNYEKDFYLSHNIEPLKCAHKVYSTKIEVKLGKAEGLHWAKLEKETEEIKKNPQTRNWDRVVAEIEEDKPEGEAALNALFQKIYNEGTDEVKKAMNKSFLESGGTELNTNWDAVRKDRVSIKPPEGMEWKKWQD